MINCRTNWVSNFNALWCLNQSITLNAFIKFVFFWNSWTPHLGRRVFIHCQSLLLSNHKSNLRKGPLRQALCWGQFLNYLYFVIIINVLSCKRDYIRDVDLLSSRWVARCFVKVATLSWGWSFFKHLCL